MDITVDISDVDRELTRLMEAGIRAVPGLEAVLSKQYAATQAQVHIITGSLKGSGKVSSEQHGGKWEGRINYGGPSTGVNNPVEYAWYEQRRRGGHDFMAPAVSMDGDYGDAIDGFMDGRG